MIYISMNENLKTPSVEYHKQQDEFHFHDSN